MWARVVLGSYGSTLGIIQKVSAKGMQQLIEIVVSKVLFRVGSLMVVTQTRLDAY